MDGWAWLQASEEDRRLCGVVAECVFPRGVASAAEASGR